MIILLSSCRVALLSYQTPLTPTLSKIAKRNFFGLFYKKRLILTVDINKYKLTIHILISLITILFSTFFLLAKRMESRNTSKVLSNRTKPNRIALSEVYNTQKSKESEVIKHWLQHGTRDSDSSKEVADSLSTVIEENEKDSTAQETVIFNGTREINIPTPRKVASPTKLTWYYLPRVVIPIVTPPEVTVSKPNFEIMKSNQSSLTTIKKSSKKSKSKT